MPTSRPTICVDMDEVLADALAEHLLRYNRDFASGHQQTERELTLADLHGRWIWDAVPPHRVRDLERYMLSEDFFRVLPVMPHAQRVIERLQSRYEVYIATAAMEVPSSFTPKFRWLAEHFPFIPASHIVFCGHKGILRADYLIDDNPRQLRLFEDKETAPIQTLSSRPERSAVERFAVLPSQREGILFSSPANVNVTGFRRVNDWLDVERLFLS
jgi:5'(3')-deoxyribonucleotidase